MYVTEVMMKPANIFHGFYAFLHPGLMALKGLEWEADWRSRAARGLPR